MTISKLKSGAVAKEYKYSHWQSIETLIPGTASATLLQVSGKGFLNKLNMNIWEHRELHITIKIDGVAIFSDLLFQDTAHVFAKSGLGYLEFSPGVDTNKYSAYIHWIADIPFHESLEISFRNSTESTHSVYTYGVKGTISYSLEI